MLVAVVNDDNVPVGLVERQAFFLRVSGKFGHALFNRRPVALLMDDSPVVIDAAVSSSDFTALTLMSQPPTCCAAISSRAMGATLAPVRRWT